MHITDKTKQPGQKEKLLAKGDMERSFIAAVVSVLIGDGFHISSDLFP